MAVTTGVSVSCPTAEWTEIVDGASYAACHVQSAGNGSLGVTVLATKPADDATGFIVLGQGGDPSVTMTLDAADSVWGRGLSGTVTARLLRTAR
jgi:hypothetical protein